MLLSFHLVSEDFMFDLRFTFSKPCTAAVRSGNFIFFKRKLRFLYNACFQGHGLSEKNARM